MSKYIPSIKYFIKCDNCGKMFKGSMNMRFCSSECSVRWHGKYRKEK